MHLEKTGAFRVAELLGYGKYYQKVSHLGEVRVVWDKAFIETVDRYLLKGGVLNTLAHRSLTEWLDYEDSRALGRVEEDSVLESLGKVFLEGVV